MSLIISLSFMLKDLFWESPFTIQCTRGNKIKATTLADTCATGYGLIDEEFAETVCQVLEIEPQRLIKPKQIQGFDSRAAKPITYTIYPILTIDTHTKSFAPLLITKLENHPMILVRPWMRKHGVIIDMTNNFLAFWPGHCTHIGATSSTTLSQPR